jgi:signal transduction histidine kinase
MNNKKEIEELKSKIVQLEKELKYQKKDNKLKNEILIRQSKQASMGEMIDTIAHQWRQPLMEISTLFINTEAKIKLLGQITNEEILQTVAKSNDIIKYMSQTIDDFRSFFKIDKKKEKFFITENISTVLNIVNSSLSHDNIKLNLIIKNNIQIYGFKNEYAQVLINIISNAKDTIVQRGIQNGRITLKLYAEGKFSILEIQDNAGGIKCRPINKVFEPFFTYKKEKGTGIGLFMSKIIVEDNMNGVLSVSNQDSGACFKIII